MTEERQAFWAKCGACAHCWPVFYLPMDVEKAAKLMRHSICPNCGESKQIFVAKQHHGDLREPGASGARDPHKGTS
jgi:hypothetical protein